MVEDIYKTNSVTEGTESNINQLNEIDNSHASVNDGPKFLPNKNLYSKRNNVEYTPGLGFVRYNHAMRNLIPMRSKIIDKEAMPADNAGLFSYTFVTWMTRYLWKAYKQGISLSDLPLISPYDSCIYNVQRLENLWQEELHRNGPDNASFCMAAWKFVRTRVYVSCVLMTFSVIFGFISPAILMRKVLEYIQSPEGTIWDGIKWALLLTLCDFLRTIFLTWTWIVNYRTALRLKSSCTALLYKKIIGLNNIGNINTGELVNLFSNDSQRLFDVVLYGPMIVNSPIIIISSIVYILYFFSPLALLGMVAFILFYPLQYLLSRLNGYLRSKTVTVTDSRVKLMNEILETIKMIKMYSWENYFCQKLLNIRKAEKSWLHKIAYFQSLSVSLTPAVPIMSAILTFLAHVSGGYNLTAAQAFPIASLFWNQLRLVLVALKDSTRYIISAHISLRRFQVFPFVSLLSAQIRTSFMFLQVAIINIIASQITFLRLKKIMLLEKDSVNISRPIMKSQSIAIANATFIIDNSKKQTDVLKKSKSKKIKNSDANAAAELEKLKNPEENMYVQILTDITFGAPKGKLIGICGQVGSGKSSLLLAILGQLKIKEGQLSREGSCAFVSQQAWIINATLKENILFGEQFDAKRYYQALTVCSLKDDLNMLPGGDETEIGERGINLSGGQKQRVALARAFYANRDIYCLDDPLSAVDAHVGNYIFNKLILDALKEKTVILVTHQIQFLECCHQIYLLQNGKISEYGTHTELMQLNKEYAIIVNKIFKQSKDKLNGEQYGQYMKKENDIGSESNAELIDSSENQDEESSKKIHSEGTTLTLQDKVETGSVKVQTYHTYIKAAGGYLMAFLVFSILFSNVGGMAFSSWWLVVWIKAGGGNATTTVPGSNVTLLSDNIIENPNFTYYRNIYAICIGIIIITSLIRGSVITYATIRASTTVHNKVFKKIIAAPLKFFETTPSGRIQNIFSRDIDEVDNYLPLAVDYMIQNIFTCMIAIFFICLVLPWFVIPLIILGTAFFMISKMFRVAMRDFKRMESTSRSPVLSFVTTTVQGLHTIHAFRKEKNFIKKFQELLDVNNLCTYMCNAAMRWSAVRLDSLAITCCSVTAFFIIFLKGKIPAALAGLAMAYATQISGVFQYTVRLMSETEVRFISVERINYYLKNLEKEETPKESLIKIDDNWPTSGKIQFKNVKMKYRKELPLILLNISFTVKPGEKMGIIGRTGSGKSSLTIALFRLVEICEGIIKIDGVDISKLELSLLRSKLSIIPQDPVLFNGTIRSNLDPFEQYSDVEIWNALEKSQLKEKVKLLNGQLETLVESNGNNFSIGERQLICLTRALLRNSKILVLDEATAAVDPETETAIQNTIHNEFVECTVLTIAHRLETILRYDKILVIKNGSILELDTPTNLLLNPNSEFSKMMAVTKKTIK